MAEPTIELDTQAYNAAPGTYDIPIIDGGVVQSGTLRWSDNGVSGKVTRPTSGNKWALELWWDATSDTKIMDSTHTPDAATQIPAMFKVSSNAVAFDTAPKFSMFDSASHTEAEEVCIGTTNHTSPFVKGHISTASTAPAQYWGEASSAALHTLEVAGQQNGSGNNGLCGATNYLLSSATNLNTTPQYLWLALSVPYDASTGTDAIDAVKGMTYTYT